LPWYNKKDMQGLGVWMWLQDAPATIVWNPIQLAALDWIRKSSALERQPTQSLDRTDSFCDLDGRSCLTRISSHTVDLPASQRSQFVANDSARNYDSLFSGSSSKKTERGVYV
jgi:hypothetical protein